MKRSNNSAPGPDGIPYAAWRKLGEQAVDILFDAFREMISEDVSFLMTRRYSDFNASLHFSSQTTIDEVGGVAIYEPSGVRPLNVTNTDNRLIASGVRTAVEEVGEGREADQLLVICNAGVWCWPGA